MKLFNESDPAPNPRRVRIFLKEKGVDIELVPTPLMKRAHKSPEHLARNPLGQVPVLELDDGTHLSESVSICRYLEELHPEPNLFGRDAKERATTDMWIRRIEFRLMMPVGQIWVHTHPFTAAVATAAFGQQFKDFGDANRKIFAGGCRLVDREIAARPFIAGDRYTMADIVAQTTFDFARFIGVDIPEDCAALKDWCARVSARPTATFEVPEAVLAQARAAGGR
ncbi:MAG: glutathione S-transferase family protein [Alphaproteobacteria bacterium]|nr:glutathione S-transferase family protein [Alphaproteobacteria bacterium]